MIDEKKDKLLACRFKDKLTMVKGKREVKRNLKARSTK